LTKEKKLFNNFIISFILCLKTSLGEDSKISWVRW